MPRKGGLRRVGRGRSVPTRTRRHHAATRKRGVAAGNDPAAANLIRYPAALRVQNLLTDNIASYLSNHDAERDSRAWR